MVDYKNSEPMKYWSAPTTMSPEMKRMRLEQMIESGDYLFGLKTDGNWSRAIIEKDSSMILSTSEFGGVFTDRFFDPKRQFDSTKYNYKVVAKKGFIST